MRIAKDASQDREMPSRDFVTPMDRQPLEMPAKEKLERCRELHRRIKDRDARIVNAQVRYVEMNEHSVFASRTADLAQRVQRVRSMVFVVVAGPDGQVRYNYNSKSKGAGLEALTWSDEELERIVKGALDLLGAERIEPGEYRVITAPGVSGVVAHESFGHGVETDMS
jgi:TldD protein